MTVTPVATRRQMALWITSLLVIPQLLSSVPDFATDMLTDSISGRVGSRGSFCAAIQSRPHAYHESRPSPAGSRIRTAHNRTPGATPTTPMPLSNAPTIPPTWVPWPLGSPHAFEFV